MAFTSSGLIDIGGTIIEAESITYTVNNTVEAINSAGFNSVLDHVSVAQKPIFQFTTKDVSKMLGFSLLVNSIATNAVNIYCQTIEANGTTNAKATKYSMTNGIWVIDSINASVGSVATCTATIYPSSTNGNASPITTVDESSSLPTYTKNESWCLVGTASINGTTVSKSTGIDITLGHNVVQDTTIGSLYVTDSYMTNYNPQITINTLDQKSARTLLGDTGKKLTSGATITLYAVSAAGVLTNTVAHTFSVAEGFCHLSDRNYSSGQRAESAIIINCSYSDTNAAIEIS